jgi:hypothetical protein
MLLLYFLTCVQKIKSIFQVKVATFLLRLETGSPTLIPKVLRGPKWLFPFLGKLLWMHSIVGFFETFCGYRCRWYLSNETIYALFGYVVFLVIVVWGFQLGFGHAVSHCQCSKFCPKLQKFGKICPTKKLWNTTKNRDFSFFHK